MLAFLQQTCLAVPRWGRGYCATAGPDESLKAEFRKLSALENDGIVEQGSRKALEPIEIEVWFHVVSSKASGDVVSDGMIATQVSSGSLFVCQPTYFSIT
jgi:hypothetical protein